MVLLIARAGSGSGMQGCDACDPGKLWVVPLLRITQSFCNCCRSFYFKYQKG